MQSKTTEQDQTKDQAENPETFYNNLFKKTENKSPGTSDAETEQTTEEFFNNLFKRKSDATNKE